MNSGNIHIMNREHVNLKVTVDTRKKLKLLAVLLGKSMMDVIDQLATEALAKQTNENSESLQV